MRAGVRFLTRAAAFAWFSAAAFAQTMTLSGTVLGADGNPLQGAQIRIDRTDMKGQYKVKTDRRGNYLYAGLPFNGVFNVVLEIDGKDADRIQGVRSRGGLPVEGVNFDLRKIAAGQSAAQQQQQQQQAERKMSEAEKAAFEKAQKEQEAALARNAELNAAFNAGRDAAAAKDWLNAIQSFEKATALDPMQHVVWGNLADAYLARKSEGDVDKAITAYAKAVEIKPDDPAYHNNYALALAQGKKFDQAQVELTRAAQIDPLSAGKYFYNLGAVYVNTGQSKPAGEAFKKAVEADPNYAEAYYQLGLVLFGDATVTPDGKIVPPPGSAQNFQKYLELAPTGPNADAAKAMLEAMGSTIETSFSTKKQPAAKKK
jgi:tetratricopeptide (TPR) repeat protein